MVDFGALGPYCYLRLTKGKKNCGHWERHENSRVACGHFVWLLFAADFWRAQVCLAVKATEDDAGVVQRPKLLEESHTILSLQKRDITASLWEPCSVWTGTRA